MNKASAWPFIAASVLTCVKSGSCSHDLSAACRVEFFGSQNNPDFGQRQTFCNCVQPTPSLTVCWHSGGWILRMLTANSARVWSTNSQAPAKRVLGLGVDVVDRGDVLRAEAITLKPIDSFCRHA